MTTWMKTVPRYVAALPVLAFPFEVLPLIYAPERTVLQLPKGQLVHSYQWCYLQRRTHRYTEFTAESLSSPRVEAMPDVMSRLSKWMLFEGMRPETICSQLRYLAQFLSWADAAEHGGRYETLLSDADLAVEALKGHHTYLRQLLQAHQIGRRTAASRDQNAIRAMSAALGHIFLDQIEPLSDPRSGGTSPPRDDQVAAFISTMQAIFDSAARSILSDGDEAIHAKPPQRLLRVSATDDSKTVPLAETYTEARLMELASIAFAALTIADSGANLSQIQRYEEPDDLAEQLAQHERVNLTQKVIKFRANGKAVPVHLTTITMSRLLKYLLIRERLVAHLDCPDIAPLFVQCQYDTSRGFAGGSPVSVRALDHKLLQHLRNKTSAIGADLPPITLRQLRSYKQQHVVQKHGVRVAAEVMGHSIATAVRAYCNSQEDIRRSDIGVFMSSLSSRVLERSIPVTAGDATVAIPPGSCSSYGQPVALDSKPVVEPNCKESEGCFFCSKFRVHADAQDSKKLLSVRYVLRRLVPLQGDSASADRVYVAVNERIEALVGEIRHRVPQIFENARIDVEERGNLSHYWAAKLQQLYLLGLLAS